MLSGFTLQRQGKQRSCDPSSPHAVAQRVLPGPAAAAHAAAAASNKQRAAAEEAITRAVSDALHAIAALKGVLPLMEGGPAKVGGGEWRRWGRSGGGGGGV